MDEAFDHRSQPLFQLVERRVFPRLLKIVEYGPGVGANQSDRELIGALRQAFQLELAVETEIGGEVELRVAALANHETRPTFFGAAPRLDAEIAGKRVAG